MIMVFAQIDTTLTIQREHYRKQTTSVTWPKIRSIDMCSV